jgi:hypothetical protein
MKISDIRGEAVVDVVADLIPPVTHIMTDPALRDLFAPRTVEEGEDREKVAVDRLLSGVPDIIKTHKGDVVAILAAVNGEDVETFAEHMSIYTLIQGVSEIFTDEELLGFFASFMTETAARAGTDAGSTSTSGDPVDVLVLPTS